MSATGPWTAEDFTRPRRRWRRGAVGAVLLAVLAVVAGALFWVADPPPPAPEPHGPGVFGQLTGVDQLPGYRIDPNADRPRLGPARLQLADGRTLFVPARTPYTPASHPCRLLDARPARVSAPNQRCPVRASLAEDRRTVTWLTVHDLDGTTPVLRATLRTAAVDVITLADGTRVPVAGELDIDGCGTAELPALRGRAVEIAVDPRSGEAARLRCST